MHLPPDAQVTTEMLWRGALYLALLDLPFVVLLAWRVRRPVFGELKWPLLGVTAVFWCGIWLLGATIWWDPVYRYVFPAWARWWLSPAYGLLFAAAALGFWWLAQRSAAPPVLGFCLLGGAWGSLTHVWAIHRGILEKPPLLRGASPAAAVILAFFEFVFYWCVILTVAGLLRLAVRRVRSARREQGTASRG